MRDPQQDPELWVVSKICGKRDELTAGNPHTHPGRFAVWCPHGQHGYNLSEHEVVETSSAGRYWIRGFVAGNEPDSPVTRNGYEKPETSRAYQSWDAARAQYIKTGIWPLGAPHRSAGK